MKMMRARTVLVGLVALTAACGGKTSTTPSTTTPNTFTFTAALLPANEIPAIGNADASGSGTATLTMNVTRDSANNITAATTTFQVNLTGFPANTNMTAAHIHEGASTVGNGAVKVSTTLANGELVLGNGTGGFTKASIATPADIAQAIINNPAGYYFNVHTSLNPGGAARGQLVKQ
jgi:CHRD domain